MPVYPGAGEADSVEIIKPETAQGLCAVLAQAHCIVMSRLHGVMLSQLLMRQVIAISFDRKVDVQMAQSGQAVFLTQIREVRSEELNEKFDQLLSSLDVIQQRLYGWYQTYNKAVLDQFDTVETILDSAKSSPRRAQALR